MLTAEMHLAQGQFLVEEQILNKDKYVMHRAGIRSPTVFSRDFYANAKK
jgi:hypothetical protein